MRAPVGVSNRHIHLTREHADQLFGKGYQFQQMKALRQPGQFACVETVQLVGPKGGIQNVRVLGPTRTYTQIEISRTDGYVLGLNAPVRDSGDLQGTPGIRVIGPQGEIELPQGVITAQRHLHLHPDDANELGVQDQDFVAVKTMGERSVILENVLCRVSPHYQLEFHVDTDEANAAGLKSGDLVQVVAVDGFHELHTFRRQNVLVLNCGSSSVKFRLYAMPEEKILLQGNEPRADGQNTSQVLERIFAQIGTSVDIIAHRVAHGADLFAEAALIDEEVLQKIASINHLAPLHNPVNLEGIRDAARRYPAVPQVAVFDTSFHHTMPPSSYLYSIPYKYYEKYKIRKYGFHGSSHRYVMERAEQMIGVKKEKLRLLSCHIGNGVSLTAIRNGQSFDTSMGLTPLAGVTMGTRSGNIDPGIIPYLEEAEGISTSEVIDLLNHQSGLLGVSGVSQDIRILLDKAKEGHARAKLALELFVTKLHKYMGLYIARMNGVDGIIFTAGIGENSPQIREWVCQGFEYAGVYLDQDANWNGQGERFISSPYSPIKVMVIPTNEEIVIARDAYWQVVKP